MGSVWCRSVTRRSVTAERTAPRLPRAHSFLCHFTGFLPGWLLICYVLNLTPSCRRSAALYYACSMQVGTGMPHSWNPGKFLTVLSQMDQWYVLVKGDFLCSIYIKQTDLQVYKTSGSEGQQINKTTWWALLTMKA